MTENGTRSKADTERLKGEANNAALNRLRAAHRPELNDYMQEEYAKRGLVWNRRLTEAEKREQQFLELVRNDVALAQKYNLTPLLADAQPGSVQRSNA